MMRAGVLFVAAVVTISLAACGKPATESSDSSAAPPAATAPPQSPAEKQAAIAALPAPYNTGDYLNGKSKFALCASCHSIAAGGPNLTGPHLHGVFGRKAGAVENFNYSDAVKAAGFAWDAEHLDKWIADPRAFIPGTKMSFIGIKDPKDRIDVIAYLKAEGGDSSAK